jgi:hypothetical protein
MIKMITKTQKLIEEVSKITYVANDGREFDDKEKCEQYEEYLSLPIEAVYCSLNRTPINDPLIHAFSDFAYCEIVEFFDEIDFEFFKKYMVAMKYYGAEEIEEPKQYPAKILMVVEPGEWFYIVDHLCFPDGAKGIAHRFAKIAQTMKEELL